jgi:hypothetical protein
MVSCLWVTEFWFDGKHKLQDYWEEEVHVVVQQKDPGLPVFDVRREDRTGKVRKLHRNLLWLLTAGGCYIEVVARAGLTVYCFLQMRSDHLLSCVHILKGNSTQPVKYNYT